MNCDQFLKKYREYITTDKNEARSEVIKVNQVLVENKAVMRKFGEYYFLMLKSDAEYFDASF